MPTKNFKENKARIEASWVELTHHDRLSLSRSLDSEV